MELGSAEKLLELLLGVRGVRVRGARFEPCGMVVEVRRLRGKARCGVCGRPCPCHDTGPALLWRHLALGRTPYWLSYAPRRVECPHHGVCVEQVPWAAHDSRFTLAFEEMTARAAQCMDTSATCQLMGIHRSTLDAIIQRTVASSTHVPLVQHRRPVQPGRSLHAAGPAAPPRGT